MLIVLMCHMTYFNTASHFMAMSYLNSDKYFMAVTLLTMSMLVRMK